MGLFSKILEKLGVKPKADVPASKPISSIPSTTSGKIPTTTYAPSPVKPDLQAHPVPGKYDLPVTPAVTPAVTAVPAGMPVVDVMAKLETLSAANTEKLNWKTSIVDLLKLLGIDSSYTSRKELAVELGCPPEKMADSAQMNVWLHKTVLQKIAENGGNIPANLLD